MINISPSNIFQKMLLLEKYYQNCQACFGRSKCEWVNQMFIVCRVIITGKNRYNGVRNAHADCVFFVFQSNQCRKKQI